MAPVQGGAAQPALAPAAFASGEFNRVPVIIGNTRHEARAFVYEGNDLIKQPVTAASVEAAIRKQQGANADRVLEIYPLDIGARRRPRRRGTDAGFACNAVPVDRRPDKMGADIVYEFRDETSPPRSYMKVPPSFPIGAAHTSDVPYVWQSETARRSRRRRWRCAHHARLLVELCCQRRPERRHLPEWPLYGIQGPRRIGLLAGGQTEQITAHGRCAPMSDAAR